MNRYNTLHMYKNIKTSHHSSRRKSVRRPSPLQTTRVPMCRCLIVLVPLTQPRKRKILFENQQKPTKNQLKASKKPNKNQQKLKKLAKTQNKEKRMHKRHQGPQMDHSEEVGRMIQAIHPPKNLFSNLNIKIMDTPQKGIRPCLIRNLDPECF